VSKRVIKAANAAIRGLENARARLEEATLEFKEWLDARSDSWKESEAGKNAAAQLDQLRSALDEIDSATDLISEVEEV
jgi:hypothetical protein